MSPPWACKCSSSLTGSAYRACGEAASALHSMLLLHVHQAKALKDLHVSGHNRAVLHELRAATDLSLRATKVTAKSLRHAMSTLVVQEGHLWLCLADRRRNQVNVTLQTQTPPSAITGQAVTGLWLSPCVPPCCPAMGTSVAQSQKLSQYLKNTLQ